MGTSDNVAIVALVVSAIALIGTTLQVIQQYMASAAGYSNLEEAVIGDWHTSKKRNFRLSEMRFQVVFETPVFFVCGPENKKGPIKNAKIYFVKGTDDSFKETRAGKPPKIQSESRGKNHNRSGSTATGLVNGLRNRLTSNNDLLQPQPQQPIEMSSASSIGSSIRRSLEEHVSRVLDPGVQSVHTTDSEMSTWVRMLQQVQNMERESSAWQNGQVAQNPPGSGFVFENHELCVALQAKRQAWDTMPSGIKRPYATTTITHLVEMAAMLGIYWKEFDRSAGRYRAEGNGYMLTGSHMPELGIVFTFQICGKSRFQENRLIPADEIKELAFGFVPTLFRDDSDIRRLAFPTDDVHDLTMLQLGSRNELAETLIALGCNTSTSNCIRDENKKHGHLFFLAFEIVGMLGRTLHLKNSFYRLLPNPTFYRWDKKYFSLRLLLDEYREKIDSINDPQLSSDRHQIRALRKLSRNIVETLKVKSEIDENSEQTVIYRPLLDSLHAALDDCDDYLKVERRRKKVVELVLREHIQELLLMVNSDSEYDRSGDVDANSSTTPGGAAEEESSSNAGDARQTSFDGLMHAPPETRQKALMDIYFSTLRQRVVVKANKAMVSHDLLRHTVEGANEVHDVWCTLVFRMLCWLLLHDFDKMDVQIPKSELRGNRLRVCII